MVIKFTDNKSEAIKFAPISTTCSVLNDCLGLYSQVIKCMWWMPRQSEAMKDVIACDKLRGGGKYPMIRRFLNGGTHPL